MIKIDNNSVLLAGLHNINIKFLNNQVNLEKYNLQYF